MTTYSVLVTDRRLEDACVLDSVPDDCQKLFRARLGKRIGDDCPGVPKLPMSPDIGGIKTYDLNANTLGYHLISDRMRELLVAHADAGFEFLGIEIINRKGRSEEGPFFVANLLDRQVRCADANRSVMRESRLRKGRWDTISKLVLDEAAIPGEHRIFRLGELPKLFIVRDDLREAIEKAGMTACRFLDMGTDIDIY